MPMHDTVEMTVNRKTVVFLATNMSFCLPVGQPRNIVPKRVSCLGNEAFDKKLDTNNGSGPIKKVLASEKF